MKGNKHRVAVVKRILNLHAEDPKAFKGMTSKLARELVKMDCMWFKMDCMWWVINPHIVERKYGPEWVYDPQRSVDENAETFKRWFVTYNESPTDDEFYLKKGGK